MMKQVFSVLIFIGLWQGEALSQETFYASKVISYSSSFVYAKNKQVYAPEQVLGKPSVSTDVKMGVCSWTPQKQNAGLEHIMVAFEKALVPSQVTIFETYNMGAIKEVWVYPSEAERRGKKIYDNPQPAVKTEPVPLQIFPKKLKMAVKAVKVVLDTRTVPGFNVIDAIAISEETKPLTVLINLGDSSNADISPAAIELLPPEINTTNQELLPVISPNGKTLYFVREANKSQDIWSVNINEDGSFGSPERFPAPINIEGRNNALLSISPDGQKILLLNEYLPNGSTAKGISSSEKGKKKWRFPEKITIRQFENKSNYGEYIILSDQKTMIMTVQRTDVSFGGKDLYVSRKLPDGSWSVPLNLGKDVNTASNEKSPFMAPDGKTLYFATNGRPGFGGTDLFVSRRLDDSWQRWSEPVNLGPSFNGKDFDAYYTLSAKGDYAYFSKAVEKGNNNLYRVALSNHIKPEPVVIVKGFVKNSKTGKPIGTEISYFDLESDTEIGVARSDEETGYYEVVLPYSRHYGFNAEKRGYIALKDNIDLKKTEVYQEIERDLLLAPIEIGKPISLNNIFFYRSQAKLLPTSNQELRDLLKYMELNSKTSIRIEGHTDNRGGVAANQDLSERRAAAIKDYLTKNGISKRRIEVAGYGGSKPIADNATDEGRRKNRRVEFVIIKL
ncbi:MAG: OmpA family protein [Cyclobacteriaceae bacterium]